MAIEQATLKVWKVTIQFALDNTKVASLLGTNLEPLRSSMDFISNGCDEMMKKTAASEKTCTNVYHLSKSILDK